jgi:hypothetical protein
MTDNSNCSSSEEEEEEGVADDDVGELSAIETLLNVHQLVTVIQFVLMFLCLVVERKKALPLPLLLLLACTALLPSLLHVSQLISH